MHLGDARRHRDRTKELDLVGEALDLFGRLVGVGIERGQLGRGHVEVDDQALEAGHSLRGRLDRLWRGRRDIGQPRLDHLRVVLGRSRPLSRHLGHVGIHAEVEQ